VTAAREALARHDVNLILPYVKDIGEAEVRAAFERALQVRNGVDAVNELADLYFFETVVRVHRAGEGAAYTGLKPAGLSVGPVIPVAERAIEGGDPNELIDLLTARVRDEIGRRLSEVIALRSRVTDVRSGRAYVEAMLGFEVWSHGVYGRLGATAHDTSGHTAHAH
jgi:hypothetical protein